MHPGKVSFQKKKKKIQPTHQWAGELTGFLQVHKTIKIISCFSCTVPSLMSCSCWFYPGMPRLLLDLEQLSSSSSSSSEESGDSRSSRQPWVTKLFSPQGSNAKKKKSGSGGTLQRTQMTVTPEEGPGPFGMCHRPLWRLSWEHQIYFTHE